ncbi:hypothetical protein [Membranihabitans marinus]|uniref:hypothetical protein n=1 Tax=Membranihabitans marinus TaxID=1227546 RepID=UPI001F31904C|nr:hypothetical protein [Membranihabitans marinus]
MKKSLFLKLKRELPSSLYFLSSAIFLFQSIAPISNTSHFFSNISSLNEIENEMDKVDLEFFQFYENQNIPFENKETITPHAHDVNKWKDIVNTSALSGLHGLSNRFLSLTFLLHRDINKHEYLSLCTSIQHMDDYETYLAIKLIPIQIIDSKRREWIRFKYKNYFLT